MDEQNKTVQPEAAAAPESRPLKKPASAKDEAPRRRVGSFTLGISLIAAGILFCATILCRALTGSWC